MNNLTVTLVQTPLHWEDPSKNRRMLEEKILAAEPAHLVILPEMFTTGFTMNSKQVAEPMTGETVVWMKQLSQRKRAILTGSLAIEEEGNCFNRLLWVLPNHQMGYYDKRHLFAYAGEHLAYSPGKKRLIGQANGWRVMPLICYDLRFPVWCRPGHEPFDLLIFVANWPQTRIDAWTTLLKARAIENQCYVIGVNRIGEDGNGLKYSGSSAVFGPMGDLLFESREETVKTLELSGSALVNTRESLPFLADADEFLLLP